MVKADRPTQEQRVARSSRRLAETAVALFAEHGYAGTSTNEIGRQAGYSRAMVQVRFGTKEALLDSILTDYYESRMDIAPDPATSGLEQVIARIRAFRTFAAEDPRFLRAVFVLQFEAPRAGAFLKDRVQTWLQRERSGFERALATGVADGSLRIDDAIAQVARDILSTGIGIAYWWVSDPDGYPVVEEIERWERRVRSDLTRGATT